MSDDIVGFQRQAVRLIDWCKHDALPLWARNGVDSAGGFYECLSSDGSPDPTADRRVRVQCRQMYVFAHAHELGWMTNGKPLADHALQYILKTAGDGASGLATCLTPDGQVSDASRDLYTHAFYLNALAWHYQAFREPEVLPLAEATLAFIDREMSSSHGGWIESLPDKLPRKQNPHMHLFEAFLALAEASGEAKYLRYADTIFKLFERHFFEQSSGNIIEFFTEDWQRCPETGEQVEPGHMMEWSWLIDRYGALTGQNLSAITDKLYFRAIDGGSDLDSGFLVDLINREGETLKATRRLWPQTEFIKAAIVKARQGHEDALRVATRLIVDFMDTYLNVPVAGAWRDCYDADGAARPGPIPASSLYHIFCAVSEVQALLVHLETQGAIVQQDAQLQSIA